MGGFSRRLGCTNSFLAEIWALRDGLILSHELNLNAFEIHLDASAIVELLYNPSNANLCALPLIDDYKLLISQIAQVRISHCYREANICADFLARLGTKQDRSFVLYNDPLVDLWELLSSDRDGLYYSRTIIDHSPPP